MTTFQAVYRATVYAPRSVDPTEQTVLTPASNAPHSQPFMVATISGLTDTVTTLGGTGTQTYQPYLGPVKGRRGRLDPLSKNVDTGQFTMDVLDKRLNVGQTDNANRWAAAFFGNVAGQNQLLGCKVAIWESIDGGATWTAFFTGRVTDIALNGLLAWTFTLYDMSVDLQVPVFVGTPSSCVNSAISTAAGYAQVPSLLPAGLAQPFGIYPKSLPMTATIQARGQGAGDNGVVYASGRMTLDSASLGRLDNYLSWELAQCGNWLYWDNLYGNRWNLARVSAVTTSGATGEFEFQAYRADPFTPAGQTGSWWHITDVYFGQLDRPSSSSPNPPNFLTMPSTGATLKFCITRRADYVTETPTNPTVFVNDVPPAQLLQDLLQGYFGYFYTVQQALPPGTTYGQPLRSLAVSSSGFDALITDLTYPPARFVVAQRETLGTWIQQNLYQPYQLAHYFNGAGQLVPVDLRRPTAPPLITITDADRVEGESPSWEYSTDSLVTNIYLNAYQDWPMGSASALMANGQVQFEPGTPYPLISVLTAAVPFNMILYNVGRSDIGIQDLTIDAQGFRWMTNEPVLSSAGTYLTDRQSFMESKLQALAMNLVPIFGGGAQSYSLVCRRTSNTTPIWPGMYVNVAVSGLVDPSQNIRGGSRIGLCVERSEDGPTIRLKFLDAGTATYATAPNLGTAIASTGDTNAVIVPVTLNASSQQAEIDVAPTSAGTGAAPATSAAAWHYVAITTQSGTVVATQLPGGTRVFVRGRTNPTGTLDNLQLPSPWTASSSNGYVDLAAPDAPSGLATTSIGVTQATITWTPASSALATQVWLTTPSSASALLKVQTLTGGAARYTFGGLVSNTTYYTSINSVDPYQGVSASTGLTFSTLAGTSQCAPLAGLAILVGGSA